MEHDPGVFRWRNGGLLSEESNSPQKGFLGLAENTVHGLPQPFVLQDFPEGCSTEFIFTAAGNGDLKTTSPCHAFGAWLDDGGRGGALVLGDVQRYLTDVTRSTGQTFHNFLHGALNILVQCHNDLRHSFSARRFVMRYSNDSKQWHRFSNRHFQFPASVSLTSFRIDLFESYKRRGIAKSPSYCCAGNARPG